MANYLIQEIQRKDAEILVLRSAVKLLCEAMGWRAANLRQRLMAYTIVNKPLPVDDAKILDEHYEPAEDVKRLREIESAARRFANAGCVVNQMNAEQWEAYLDLVALFHGGRVR